MPYTLAHIGYVIPIKKKWGNYFSSTGLVFGSIAPDYDILFRFTQNRFHIFNYNLPTIFFIIYPLAFISALAFHFFCRSVIIQYLPSLFENRYANYKQINLNVLFKDQFISFSISIISAVFLHLLLDNICHILNAYDVKIFVLKLTRNTIIASVSYFSAIYFLPVLFTLFGFYLLYKNLITSGIKLSDFYMNSVKTTFWASIALITLLILILKVSLSTIEKSFIIDFILITFTSSFITAFYLVCGIYYLYLKRLSKKTS